MSWEVWTMPQKTSFCNRTLLRSDLHHFWPAGFVYVLIWLMILPIQLLRAGYDAPRDDGLLAENLEALLHNVIVGASVGSLVLAVGRVSVRARLGRPYSSAVFTTNLVVRSDWPSRLRSGKALLAKAT